MWLTESENFLGSRRKGLNLWILEIVRKNRNQLEKKDKLIMFLST
jgi:hypothetical protein